MSTSSSSSGTTKKRTKTGGSSSKRSRRDAEPGVEDGEILDDTVSEAGTVATVRRTPSMTFSLEKCLSETHLNWLAWAREAKTPGATDFDGTPLNIPSWLSFSTDTILNGAVTRKSGSAMVVTSAPFVGVPFVPMGPLVTHLVTYAGRMKLQANPAATLTDEDYSWKMCHSVHMMSAIANGTVKHESAMEVHDAYNHYLAAFIASAASYPDEVSFEYDGAKNSFDRAGIVLGGLDRVPARTWLEGGKKKMEPYIVDTEDPNSVFDGVYNFVSDTMPFFSSKEKKDAPLIDPLERRGHMVSELEVKFSVCSKHASWYVKAVSAHEQAEQQCISAIGDPNLSAEEHALAVAHLARLEGLAGSKVGERKTATFRVGTRSHDVSLLDRVMQPVHVLHFTKSGSDIRCGYLPQYALFSENSKISGRFLYPVNQIEIKFCPMKELFVSGHMQCVGFILGPRDTTSVKPLHLRDFTVATSMPAPPGLDEEEPAAEHLADVDVSQFADATATQEVPLDFGEEEA